MLPRRPLLPLAEIVDLLGDLQDRRGDADGAFEAERVRSRVGVGEHGGDGDDDDEQCDEHGRFAFLKGHAMRRGVEIIGGLRPVVQGGVHLVRRARR